MPESQKRGHAQGAQELQLLERLRFTFTPNGRREFLPRDPVSPLIFRLLFIASTQK